MSKATNIESDWWDRLGIGLSGICALHCLLVPVALAMLPIWPVAFAVHEWVHPILALLILPMAWIAVRSARRHTHATQITILLALGLVLVIGAWGLHDVLGIYGEAAVTIIGSGFLITGHWRNWRHLVHCSHPVY